MTQSATIQTSRAGEAVDLYVDAWNDSDPTARLETIRSACVEDFAYTDPYADVKGHQALSEMIGAARAKIAAQHPNAAFIRTSGIDEHHDRLRFTWALRAQDGTVVLSGTDFGQVDETGRLRAIVGFFGDVPAAANS